MSRHAEVRSPERSEGEPRGIATRRSHLTMTNCYTSPMISFSHVSLEKHGLSLLDDVNFDVEPGECICLSSSDSSGKTAVLRLLAIFDRPSKGTVTVDNIDLSSLPPPLLQLYRRNIGFLAQEDRLIPDQTVAGNIALPLRIKRLKREAIEQRVTELLFQSDLLQKAALLPSLLTQSERRKVAFLRAVAAHPKILLLDSPPEDMVPFLKSAREHGATILFATDSLHLPQELDARIIQVSNIHSFAHSA